MPHPMALIRILVARRFAYHTNWWASCSFSYEDLMSLLVSGLHNFFCLHFLFLHLFHLFVCLFIIIIKSLLGYILVFFSFLHGCSIYNNNTAICKIVNKKLTNWLGQAKPSDTKIRSKAVGDGIFGVFRDDCGLTVDGFFTVEAIP